MGRGLVIARGGLNLRESPKTGNVLSTLRRGSKVEILEEETWLKVKKSDGSVGYVLADYIEKEDNDLVDQSTNDTPVSTAVADVLSLANDEQDQCVIKTYANSQFIGKELRADVDFLPHLDRLNQYALDCAVKIYVTSSAREPGRSVSGAIVPPASRSNHLVGHAIDMNLQSASGFFNSSKLKKTNLANLPGEIQDLLNLVKGDEVLRWGGEFNPEDPVHIDDELNRRNPNRWDLKLNSR
ncbi:MAG: hypothetical protein DRR42_20220 [Gammaproteobacteria bacterium]|nr:MAG: hypothetical protein DRR42_20220 [Gammaproteobacteria bacterium]